MEYKINRWGKLDQQQVSPMTYDLGGVLSGIGSGAMTVGPLTGPAAPFVMAGGAVASLLGNVLSGNSKKKEQEELMKQQKQRDIQNKLLSQTAKGGILSGPRLELGGFLTPQLLAKSGMYIKPQSKQIPVTKMAEGGFVNPLATQYDGLLSYTKGGTHQQNPLGGIPLGTAATGKPNTVEQGETSFKFKEGKYIFSNRLRL